MKPFRTGGIHGVMWLEEYGVIGDLYTAALVGSNGSIDWLCLPRFDSDACLASLLGRPDNGHWRIAPTAGSPAARRRYRPDTLVLEQEFETREGTVRVIDFMPPGDPRHDVVRIVEGLSGRVKISMSLAIRFDYGTTVPWVQRADGGIRAVAGPNALLLHSEVPTQGAGLTTTAEFTVEEGQRRAFVLTWARSYEPLPKPIDAFAALEQTEQFWREWCRTCTYRGPWREAVMRSLITLKALTFEPTGGIVAAATTSLPEHIGGVRNWDYRYCWLRDATFTLYSLLNGGYTDEAAAWGDWLLRAVAGDPSQLQMLYGVAGERALREFELPHLSGYENSRPVRVGNAAATQFQLDVYGEILDAAQLKREKGLETSRPAWNIQRHLVEFVASNWKEPDEGIWEIRGPRRHFTHSKVMAWVAMDRGIKAVERFQLKGDVERWRRIRDEIHADVCERGYDHRRGVFTQHYGSEGLDGALLQIPLVGFLPAKDPRVARTIHAIRRDLDRGGLVLRYDSEAAHNVDGLPPGEGVFLPCSFWLVDCLFLLGEIGEARRLFEHLLTLCSPLGLLAEEYDPVARRLLGNFPQAFSHVALVNSAYNLSGTVHPAEDRSGERRTAG